MSNFNQKVIYKLRDLGYYGEFNERDVGHIIQNQPKMKHLFAFIKDQLASGSEGNVLDEADLETEKQVLDELQMTAADLEDVALDKDLARMIGYNT